MRIVLFMLITPSFWPVLAIYGAVALLLSAIALIIFRPSSLKKAAFVSFLCTLSTFVTTPYLDDNFFNVSDSIERALPFAELLVVPIVSVLAYMLFRPQAHGNKA